MIVASIDAESLDSLLAIAEPLARSAPPRELILVRLVPAQDLVQPRASSTSGRSRSPTQGSPPVRPSSPQTIPEQS